MHNGLSSGFLLLRLRGLHFKVFALRNEQVYLVDKGRFWAGWARSL
jgi:hypothetical protein